MSEPENKTKEGFWEENYGCGQALLALLAMMVVGLLGQGGIATETAFAATIMLAHVVNYYLQVANAFAGGQLPMESPFKPISIAILWLGITVGWCTGGMPI
jgi:hypothetical protein